MAEVKVVPILKHTAVKQTKFELQNALVVQILSVYHGVVPTVGRKTFKQIVLYAMQRLKTCSSVKGQSFIANIHVN